MARREKTEFILDQVNLCIECNEWTQAAILSRKIGTKYFARKPTQTPEQLEKARKDREEYERTRSADDPPVEPEDDVTDLKLIYYTQQVDLAKNESKYLDACKHYRQVLDTQAVEDDPAKLAAVSIAHPSIQTLLMVHRHYDEFAGMSSWHRMTTSNTIFYTASKPIHAIPNCPTKHSYYVYSLHQS
jgi:hypothetical protein